MPDRPLFDPALLPIELPSLDDAAGRLSPVPLAAMSAEALRRRFAESDTLRWTPERAELRQGESVGQRALRAAAVLVPLVLRDAGLTVLLTQRAAHLTDHAGQISFPGGRCDPEDRDVTATALREAWEEIALEARHVEPLGTMPEYVTGTGYAVTPVVALVHPPFTVEPSEREVAECFEVPLAFLMDPTHHQVRVYRPQADLSESAARRFFSMPYPRADGDGEHFIWGATAGMLRNLYRFLAA
jgi:8-oxo-dGTP pyrophosphatase MutT (NUDIX family)